ncbi:MAG: beta-1,6-N-acetylglucosaminyltransferase [Cyanobacteriota bacterium]|nr:beta-1,6-N-acetylglucosaminyltransferase [Cyanobacteriota bacterium]
MKACYLILSHKNPKQIYRLIRTIKTASPDCHIILSHDPRNCDVDVSRLEKIPGVYVQFATADRGDFSLVQNYFSAVDWLLKNNIDFDWLIKLSAQDYPTQPISEIEYYLSKTQYDGFMEYFKVFSSESHWSMKEGSGRYLYRYRKFPLPLPSWLLSTLKVTRIVNHLQNFLRIDFEYGLRFGFRPKAIFNRNFQCYGGLFFTILSKKCINYLYSFYHNNPHIVDYYKETLIPEESLIQTILINSKKFKFYNECKHYIDFSNSIHGHPKILTENDYDAMTQENYFFARKFDLNLNSRIFDILDQYFANKHSRKVSESSLI